MISSVLNHYFNHTIGIAELDMLDSSSSKLLVDLLLSLGELDALASIIIIHDVENCGKNGKDTIRTSVLSYTMIP